MADEPDYEPSEASSYDPTAALLDNISQPSKKRRQSLGFMDAQQPKKLRLEEAGDDPAVSKKSNVLMVDRAKQLPGEVWQHVFTLVPPKDLGRLLIVNKLFHLFLNPSVTGYSSRHSDVSSSLPHLKPDAIWQASRRLFWPRMPAPLKGKSEIQMWRLVCSTSCQFCGSRSQKNSQSSNNEVWRSGPGLSDVCPIFPFCILTCGNCLNKNGIRVGLDSLRSDVCLTSATGNRSPIVFHLPFFSAAGSPSHSYRRRHACHTSPCHADRSTPS